MLRLINLASPKVEQMQTNIKEAFFNYTLKFYVFALFCRVGNHVQAQFHHSQLEFFIQMRGWGREITAPDLPLVPWHLPCGTKDWTCYTNMARQVPNLMRSLSILIFFPRILFCLYWERIKKDKNTLPLLFSVVLSFETRTSCMQDICFTTESPPGPKMTFLKS